MGKVTDFIKKMEAKDWFIVIMAAVIIFLVITTFSYYRKYNEAERNCVIWNDSAYIYRNKYHEEYLAKNTYIMTIKQLKEYNKQLYEEAETLRDNPVVITKTNVVTRIDSVIIVTDRIDSTGEGYAWAWKANDSTYYMISGNTVLRKDLTEAVTSIDNIYVPQMLTMDVVDDGEQLSVIAKSDNPYVLMTGMQSVVIDPTSSPTLKKYFKAKRWGFGPSFTFGATYGYDPIFGRMSFVLGVTVGVSVQYSWVQW